jgi:phosphopantetheine--protein transferase-like protein
MGYFVGTDIVKISRIKQLDENSLRKIFHASELKSTKPESLAGILAAKESIIKACGKKLAFLDIEIKKEKSGRPKAVIKGIKVKISISHDGEYAIAFALVEK